jgi:hypothetical protein
MPAQRKYPDELRERAVKMAWKSVPGRARVTVSWPGWAVSWVFIPRLCVAGSARPRSTMGRGRESRRRISSGSRNWNAKSVNCAARMRS